MKKIFLIRHAESEANVSKIVFPHDNTIKLSENGRLQAIDLAEILERDLPKPDKIIVSKLIRTIETAEPLLNKFPETETHLWMDIHEYDPMFGPDQEKLIHSDYLEMYKIYWNKKDLTFKNHFTGENFIEFTDRVNSVILKMKRLNGVNYVFSHGWFIKMLYLMTQEFSNFNKLKIDKNIYKKIFDRFIQFDTEFKTKNTGVYDVTTMVEKYVVDVV